MTRSRKKVSSTGWTTSESEKKDKQSYNRRFRRINRLLLKLHKPLYHKIREIINIWDMDKDGKHLWEYRSKDIELINKFRRK